MKQQDNINPNEAWTTLCNVYPLTIIEAIRLIKIVLSGLQYLNNYRFFTDSEVQQFIQEYIEV
jgi:hypothetical protein